MNLFLIKFLYYLANLKSMEQKLFGTDGIRGVANKYPMTPELVLLVGKAVASVFKNSKKRSKVLIGKDTRISGYILETALTSGICSMGVDVLLVGPMPTAAIAHLTKSMGADVGIMISASHNPAEDNGIKFFCSEGFKLQEQVEKKIEGLVLNNNIKSEHVYGDAIGKAYRIEDARGRYIEYAKQTINNRSLSGLKIVLDCANGASYVVAPTIFRELGANVIVLNNKPDGLNINKNCGVFHLEHTIKAVEKEKADLGIILDGDADRVILVDEHGTVIDGDAVMAIAALDLKKKGKLYGNMIVTTVMANYGFHEFLRKNKIDAAITPVGDKYVVEALRARNLSLGGEQSGHIVFAEYGTSPDGILVALQMLEIMAEDNKPLSKLLSGFKQFPQLLVNIPVKKKVSFEKMPVVLKEIKTAEKQIQGRGRVLVRYSGTENIARVMVEGKSDKEIRSLADKISEKIKKEVGI